MLQYEDENFITVRIRDSRKMTLDGVDREAFPKKMVKYVCRNFGVPQPRGKNVRPNQSYSQLGCPFEFTITYTKQIGQYVVTNMTNMHRNHEISEMAYKLDRKKRKLSREEEDIFVNAELVSPPVSSSTSTKAQPTEAPVMQEEESSLPSTVVSSQRRGAAWAGGIGGLVVGGPIGAGLGAWGAHHLAKHNEGKVGTFCRQAGDFTTRMGTNIKQEWREATSKNR